MDELRDAPSTTDRLGGANSHTDTNNEANAGNSANSIDLYSYPRIISASGLTAPASKDEMIQNGEEVFADISRVDNTVSIQHGDGLLHDMVVGAIAGAIPAVAGAAVAVAVAVAVAGPASPLTVPVAAVLFGGLGAATAIATDGEVSVTITTTSRPPRRDANFSENDSNNHGGGGGSDFGGSSIAWRTDYDLDKRQFRTSS